MVRPHLSLDLSTLPRQYNADPKQQVVIVHDKVGDVRAYPAAPEGLDKYAHTHKRDLMAVA